MIWSTTAAAAEPPAQRPQPTTSAPRSDRPAAAGRFALLVGCTKYAHLPVQQLAGPANDVALLRTLLQQQFEFPEDKIVTLLEPQSGEADEGHRPTRTNIEREFARLTKTVTEGDQVVILLSGHGTQQPQGVADDDDLEPDGLDEVFLPIDARPYDRKSHCLPGAIIDDELGRWVRRIRDHGARVWIIVDCCHSGTIIRGSDDEVVRRVPPEKIIPRDVLQAARRAAEARHPKSRGESLDAARSAEESLGGDLKNVVALYAAQAEQSTIELPLPAGAAEQQPYGLLSFTLGEILRTARSPLTYRELAQRIQRAYIKSGRTSPTPLLEGEDVDREVLGLTVWPYRSSITLGKTAEGWRIDAGALRGLTVGSVLAVSPPAASEKDSRPIGCIKVTSLGVLSAQVIPCAYGELAEVANLPEDGRCEIKLLDTGLRQLRVYFDGTTDRLRKASGVEPDQLSQRNPLIQVAVTRNQADWIVRADKEQFYLEPARGMDAHNAGATPRFGPVPADGKASAWLEEHLRRIARAQNLLALIDPAAAEARATGAELAVTMQLVEYRDKSDQEGKKMTWQTGGVTVRAGDMLGCTVHNSGRVAADVTLLFIDSGYGIKTVFPGPGTVTDNRVFPGESLQAFRGKVNAKTVGLEHLVMIAVPGDGAPIDFGALDQPSLAVARGGGDKLGSPLGRLLQNALYTGEGKRGFETEDFNQQQLELRSWRVQASP